MSIFIDNIVHWMTSNGVSKTYEAGLVGQNLTALHHEIIYQHQTLARCDWALGSYIFTLYRDEYDLIRNE